jgi:predicted nucleic acid-binding protein
VTLVDTSCWVHQIRTKGDPSIRASVDRLLAHGQAAWCAPVRLELWAGARSESDRKMLNHYQLMLPDLEISPAIWNEACALAGRCRKAGKTAPANDVLIAACARHHGVDLERADAHFDFLLTL